MAYLFLYTYDRHELQKFHAYVSDNLKRGWKPSMHELWTFGRDLAERLLND